MILDILENSDRYATMHPDFATAFAMLKRSNVALFPEGRLEIDGDEVYALIAKGPGRTPEEGRLETHDRHIDIQYVISGTDTIGWKARQKLSDPDGPHDPERDLAFYHDEPDAWATVRPGMFAIFFPEDAHMPMISPDELHKVVIKVAV